MLKYRITHKTGICATSSTPTGYISHVVINGKSLCGSNPGKHSDWSEYNDKIITCKKCEKKLAELEGNK